MTQLSPQIQNELFPGVIMDISRAGFLAGSRAQEGPGEFAGRFSALLDMAGSASNAPLYGIDTMPSETASFSAAFEPDRLYDSRPPEAAELWSADQSSASALSRAETPGRRSVDQGSGERLEAEDAASQKANNKAGISAEADEAEISPETLVPAFFGNRNPAEKSAAEENAGETAEDALAQTKNSRGKPKFPGEDLEKIPGFEEGVLADAGAGVTAKTKKPAGAGEGAISGEPREAADAEKSGPRPAHSEKAEKSGENGFAGTVLPASSEQTAEEQAALASAEEQAALFAGETAEAVAEREGLKQNTDRLAAKTDAETGLKAAEVAALPLQGGAAGGRQQKAPERVEKNGREEPGETKKSDRRRERLNLELRDFRTVPKADNTAVPEKGGRENSGGEHAMNHGQEAEITVELKSQAHSQAGFNRENRPQVSFRETLARELHENLNGDIVRHASVVLKNGGEGLIRLSLKPEHLGNVKIRLEMAENKIVGKITVESNEALRAFEQELRSLEQAFRDSGFEGATLEMAVASDSGQDGAGRQGENGEASDQWSGPFFSERLAAHSYDAASNETGSDTDGMRWFSGGVPRQVNVLA